MVPMFLTENMSYEIVFVQALQNDNDAPFCSSFSRLYDVLSARRAGAI